MPNIITIIAVAFSALLAWGLALPFNPNLPGVVLIPKALAALYGTLATYWVVAAIGKRALPRQKKM